MEQNYLKLQNSLISIASELFRFQKMFEKAISKLEFDEQRRYMSQYTWFSKRVYKALDEAGFTLLSLEGKLYDTGMAVTPLNIDEFNVDDELYIVKTIEPVIMCGDTVYKTGTVILGRIER